MADTGTELRPGLLASLRRLTDAELVARVEDLARREHVDTALLVAHLAELDTRDVYLRSGYSSLFTYCREALALSEHESYNRIEVARAARRFPVVLELLASGAVNLTSVRLLAPHLTPENHRTVLESARGKKRGEVEEIVARLAPFPEVPPSIRKLPPPRLAYPPLTGGLPPVLPPPCAPAGSPPAVALGSGAPEPIAPHPIASGPIGPGPTGGPTSPGATAPGEGPGAASPIAGRPALAATAAPSPAWPGAPATSSSSTASPAPAHAGLQQQPCGEARSLRCQPSGGAPTTSRCASGEVTPLAPDRYRMQCTISGATLEKLRLAQDMLRHAIPSGDEAAILDRAFTALLVDLARSKFAAVENPQPPRGTAPGSRYVPAEVKRTVWVRDLGRCAFVGTDGRRCNERAFVEFHHVRPYAAGGAATVENIQLRCRRHNGYESRRFFDRRDVFDGGPDGDGSSVVREACARYVGGTTDARPSRLVPESEAGSVLPEACAPYLSGRTEDGRTSRLVPKRVRTSESRGPNVCRRGGRRAPRALEMAQVREALTRPSGARADRARSVLDDGHGRARPPSSAARESRPPPRRA